jgi:hypothetical protein
MQYFFLLEADKFAIRFLKLAYFFSNYRFVFFVVNNFFIITDLHRN